MPTWNCIEHQAAWVYNPFKSVINPCPWCRIEQLENQTVSLQKYQRLRMQYLEMIRANRSANKGIQRLKRKLGLARKQLEKLNEKED